MMSTVGKDTFIVLDTAILESKLEVLKAWKAQTSNSTDKTNLKNILT